MADQEHRQVANPGILKAAKFYRNREQFAEALGVTAACLTKWIWKRCPAERAVEIEKLTGISRKEIRPDIFE